MSNAKLLPFLFIGFIMVIYLNMDVIGVAAAATCVALLIVFNKSADRSQATEVEEEDF